MISDRPTVTAEPTYRRKLIEVDLPLDDINRESAREKSIRHGHPSTLHLWWARRPLAACRAVIFASMVDDPLSCGDEFPTPEARDAERERLHDIIRRLVVWENSGDEALLAEARYEIARSVARARGETAPTTPGGVLRYLKDRVPPVYDPFCGGGSIPLEAQRLGLRAVASDLNPVAVLITKALIELPPKFSGQPPVNPEADPMGMTTGKGKRKRQVPWRGAAGLADDIRHYGRWMRERAFERIGHLYPKVKLPGGGEATVIAWLWARTVPCPNPACGIAMPLMRTFQVSKKKGNVHWTRPVVRDGKVSFAVQDHDGGVPSEGTVNRNGATCIACSNTVPLAYVRERSRAGRMGEQMTAIVAEGDRKRVFLSPAEEHVQAALSAKPGWRPRGDLPEQALGFRVQRYGFTRWHHLFTERQLVALTTFSDLMPEVRALMLEHEASTDYADVVCTYLVLASSKNTEMNSSFARWESDVVSVRGVFARQAIPVVWDFAEANPFSKLAQNWIIRIEWVAKVVEHLIVDVNYGESHQADASTTVHTDRGPVIVTDPPYYANIGYADLSDFFYVWLRSMLRDIYPGLFAGILTPKGEEMIATQFRFEEPKRRFEHLLGKTLNLVRERCTDEFPSSIFYAYKQQIEEREGLASTGWETMLTGLVDAGFQIIGTWPMRTEGSGRLNAMATNALASSVVLVCRPRPENAPVATRRQFLDALDKDLPGSLDHLTREGHIAPVDLAQAAIGPGMEIYSRFARVETISGEPVPVREALAAINRAIAAYDRRQEGDLDSETRFCLDWLRQHGFAEGRYGEAETLARAKDVAVGELGRLLEAGRGNVRLLPVSAYGDGRPPLGGMTAWEGCFRMAYHFFEREQGRTVNGAAQVARAMRGNVDSVERLARILYNHFDRKNDSPNAVAFNSLVTSWDSVIAAAQAERQVGLL